MNEEKAMKAYKALRSIESAEDLKRNKLTLAEYREACEVIQDYASNDGYSASTIHKSVAEWFERHGFEVSLGRIGYTIR